MNAFLRHCLSYNKDADLLQIAMEFRDIVRDQKEIISWQRGEIERLKLEYTRWGRDCMEGFLIALDKPEEEDALRENLSAALVDLGDEVARLEEHIST